MPTAAKKKLLTAEEFMRLPDPPDGSQQELVRGEIITMPPPMGAHGVCCSLIAMIVGQFVKERRLGFVTCNDAGTILERNPDTV
jgi:Uma2 family endonuclease